MKLGINISPRLPAFSFFIITVPWGARGKVVATSRKVAGSILEEVTGFFN
jgi:hypothetical protein